MRTWLRSHPVHLLIAQTRRSTADIQPPTDGAISAKYGQKGAEAFRSMVTTKGTADAMISTCVPLPGRATVRGTEFTMQRSTVFDKWNSVAVAPVGWHMSKLGCATCKMAKDTNEGVDSLQLQIVKGLNVFEIDSSVSETYEHIARGMSETLSAFELEREGIVLIVRAGLMRQQSTQDEQTTWEITNVAALRERFKPTISRVQASTLPGLSFKSGFNFQTMTDEQLWKLRLRRVTRKIAAAITREWLEAAVTNVSQHTRIETIDVFLVEGLHTLFDGRSDDEIDNDLLDIFQWAEEQVKHGVMQYYGVSSPNLAPPLPRVYPSVPKDAMMPERYLKPYVPPIVMNLHRLLEIAKRAGGENHHLRFISYPFNLTQHQAWSARLPYEPSHTLCSLAKKLGITAVTYCPIEAPDLQDIPQRYHRFPLVPDLATARLNYFNVLEKVLLKEMEISPMLEKVPSAPPLENLFLGSMYVILQRQLSSAIIFDEWLNTQAMPRFRRALQQLREGSMRDVKDWANQYEQLAFEALRYRRGLLDHKHGLKSLEVDAAIDRVCPKLGRCPIISQKALNFALHGGDVCLAGFNQTRYFHEATELNPGRCGGLGLTEKEIGALCKEQENISFVNYNPPHPYMYEPMPTREQGKISGQKQPSLKHAKIIDLKNPDWPDIPKEVEGAPQSPAKTTQTVSLGTTAAPTSGPGTYPPTAEAADAAKEVRTTSQATTRYFPQY